MTKHPTSLADAVRSGDRRALAQAITLVESTNIAHRADAVAMLEALHGTEQTSMRIGISGAPGAGKSTLIEALGTYFVHTGHRVAVLAVDPSSQRSGGSILGDKTRMETLARKREAFVRPSPSGGALGGVARRTRDAMVCCEAAGFDIVLVETVGVGQSETAVADMVDVFALIVSPAGGDELQGIKRGIMELADIVVVNKADGALLPAAREACSEYARALHFLRPRYPSWSAKALMVSALEHEGIDSLAELIGTCIDALDRSGDRSAARGAQNVRWLWAEVFEELQARMHRSDRLHQELESLETAVREGSMAPASAAAAVLKTLDSAAIPKS